MTNQEAINSLKNIIEYWTVRPTEVEAAQKAIEVLETVESLQAELDQWKCDAISSTAKLGERRIEDGLACKLGDMVFLISDDEILEIELFGLMQTKYGLRCFDNTCDYFGTIGKDVFITKEEAEKRLAELEGGVSND